MSGKEGDDENRRTNPGFYRKGRVSLAQPWYASARIESRREAVTILRDDRGEQENILLDQSSVPLSCGLPTPIPIISQQVNFCHILRGTSARFEHTKVFQGRRRVSNRSVGLPTVQISATANLLSTTDRETPGLIGSYPLIPTEPRGSGSLTLSFARGMPVKHRCICVNSGQTGDAKRPIVEEFYATAIDTTQESYLCGVVLIQDERVGRSDSSVARMFTHDMVRTFGLRIAGTATV